MSNTKFQAGKGDKSRVKNIQVYRENYDGIRWKKDSSYKIGDTVSVPCRFGESGIIKEIEDDRYGLEFKNLEFIP